jgi:prepilin signal peptidase PulO-like enzyme (type II secretory pathway)
MCFLSTKTLHFWYSIPTAITGILKSLIIIFPNVIRDVTSAVGALLGNLVQCGRLLRFTRSKTYSMDLMTGRGEFIRETLTSLTPITSTLL